MPGAGQLRGQIGKEDLLGSQVLLEVVHNRIFVLRRGKERDLAGDS